MSLKGHWKRKHGLTLVQMQQLRIERIQDMIIKEQERELFTSMDTQSRLVAELEREHKAYLEETEARILAGWRPNSGEWAAIEMNLAVFAKRRKQLTDPMGLTTFARSLEAQREREKKARELWGQYTYYRILR